MSCQLPTANCQLSDRLASCLYRFRNPLSLAAVLGALALAPLANITNIDNDITAWFSRTDPVFQTYERFREEFGGTRTLIIAVRGDRLFTPEGLRFLRDVTSEIERVPAVQRVHSLANANVVRAIRSDPRSPGLRASRFGEARRSSLLPMGGGERRRPTPDPRDEGGLEVKPLLDRPIETIDDAQAVKTKALAEPLIRGDLVSEDGTVAAVVVGFDEDRVDAVRAAVLGQIREIVASRLPGGMEAFFNGSLEISETYNRITLYNQRAFVPPILVLTLGAIYLSFGSVRKTLMTFAAILVSLLWTLGAYSLMGYTYNVLSSMIIPLIGVIAVADDVHIMQRFEEELRAGRDPEHAFKMTVSHLLMPLFGASVTTALGMLSLATSDVVAVRAFGIGSAVGIMIDFAISVVLVPTMLARLKPEPGLPPHQVLLVEPMRRLAAFSVRRPALIVVVSAVTGLTAMWGIGRLRVDTNHINFFDESHPLSRSAAVIDEKLSGIYSFQVLVEGPPDSLKSPSILRRIDSLERELHKLPYVKETTSVAEYVKRVNQELNDGDPRHAVIPASQEAVAQELFVFSLSDAGRSELERLVASDYSRGQITVKLASMSSDLVFDQIHQAERLARAAFQGTPIETTITGSGRLFSTLDHYLVMSQVSSFGTAFVTVFGVIFLVFRSVRFGALAIVANAVPVLAVLGLMGWLDISMNIATVMLASVALGVVDDDTVHFISRFRRETDAGATTERAIELATVHEGRASLTSAFINSLGYAVLMLSEYKPNAWFGQLLALTMAVAFLAEVFIVPAIITLLPGIFSTRAVQTRITMPPVGRPFRGGVLELARRLRGFAARRP